MADRGILKESMERLQKLKLIDKSLFRNKNNLKVRGSQHRVQPPALLHIRRPHNEPMKYLQFSMRILQIYVYGEKAKQA